jgi:hypothetical protein
VTIGLRHYCRNVRCRSKLKAPVENEHHAFCTPGCHQSFYWSRCLVCEKVIRRKNEHQKFGSGHAVCRSEHRRFPHAYDYPPGAKTALTPSVARVGGGCACAAGLKSGDRGDRPPFRCLADWCWGGDPGAGDHSLYDADGLTLARIVLERDGRYHLRSPRTCPRMSWDDLDPAKRRAESLALASLPLDPKLAARVKRDNETPHPMGLPPNRPPTGTTTQQ